VLNIGDKVRMNLSLLYPELREKIKQGNTKYVIAKFSNEIYTVVSKTRPKSPFLRETYRLEDENGNKLGRLFYYNE